MALIVMIPQKVRSAQQSEAGNSTQVRISSTKANMYGVYSQKFSLAWSS